MFPTKTDSVNSAQSYSNPFEPVALSEVLAGKSRSGQKVELTSPAPVLNPPESVEALGGRVRKDSAGIGKRLACPFYTAGNLFIKTAYKTGRLAGYLAGVSGLLVGGIAGAVVSSPIAAVVKLAETLARTRTSFGKNLFLCGTLLGAVMVAGPTASIGNILGKLAGAGLGIVSGMIGFGKGVRDAVTGDVHRLEREKLTLKDFFEQARITEEEARKTLSNYFTRFGKDKAAEVTLNQSGSSAVDLPRPEFHSLENQKEYSFSSLRLELSEGDGTGRTA